MANFPTVVSSKYPSSGQRIPNCSRPLKESIKTDNLIVTFDSGFEQRRKRSDPKRIFEPQYTVLTKDQYYTIRDHFLEVLNITPFQWVHPIDGTIQLVRYDTDTFLGENFAHGVTGPLYKLQFRLLEVWA